MKSATFRRLSLPPTERALLPSSPPADRTTAVSRKYVRCHSAGRPDGRAVQKRRGRARGNIPDFRESRRNASLPLGAEAAKKPPEQREIADLVGDLATPANPSIPLVPDNKSVGSTLPAPAAAEKRRRNSQNAAPTNRGVADSNAKTTNEELPRGPDSRTRVLLNAVPADAGTVQTHACKRGEDDRGLRERTANPGIFGKSSISSVT